MYRTVFRRYRRLVAFATTFDVPRLWRSRKRRGARRGRRGHGSGRRRGPAGGSTQGRSDSRRPRADRASLGARPRAHGARDVPRSLAGHLWWVTVARARLPGLAVAAEHPHRLGRLRGLLGRQRQRQYQTRHRPATKLEHPVSARAGIVAPHACLRERTYVRPGPGGTGRQSLPGDDPDLPERGHLHHRRPLYPIRRLERLGPESRSVQSVGGLPHRHGNGAVHVRTSRRRDVRRRHLYDAEARGAFGLRRDLSLRPAQRRSGGGRRGSTSLPDGIPALRAVRQVRHRQQPRRQYDRRYALELLGRPPDAHLRCRLVQVQTRRRVPETLRRPRRPSTPASGRRRTRCRTACRRAWARRSSS